MTKNARRRSPRPEAAMFIRLRWATWLMRAITKARTSQTSLARELASDQENLDTWPRTRLREWLRGARTVDVELAFRVGKALQLNGHPYATGLLAVFAAGYIGDVYAALRNIVLTEPDARVLECARIFVEYSPMIVEADIASQIFLMSPDAVNEPHLSWGDFPGALRYCPGYQSDFFSKLLEEERTQFWCEAQEKGFLSRRKQPLGINEGREKAAALGNALSRMAGTPGLSPWDALEISAQANDRWAHELRRAAFDEEAVPSWTEWTGGDYYLTGYLDLVRWNREKVSDSQFTPSMDAARAAIEAGNEHISDFIKMLASLQPAAPYDPRSA